MDTDSEARETPPERDHVFDGVGVCIFCNSCDEPTCCPQAAEPCSRAIVKRTMKSAEKIRAMFATDGR